MIFERQILTRIWSAFLAVSLVSASAIAAADPLSDLDRSPEMQKFNSGAKGDDLYSPRYMKEDSNFGSVFIPSDGYMNLQNWIAPAEGGFTGGAIAGIRLQEYVEAWRPFTSDKSSEIRVRILVPHPKFISMLKYGLVKPFADIEPPALEYLNKEQIDIRGTRADIYVLKDNACSLVMHIALSTVVQLTQTECAGLNNLVTLAELLDIKRLERKLQS